MRHSAIISFAAAIDSFIASTVAHKTPSVFVPSCSHSSPASLTYSKALPNLTDFPLTQVDLCYTDSFLDLTLTAYNETSFFYNASQGTNDLIFEYEAMEAFLARGTEDSVTYFEFEVNPNNVTLQTFVYNPSKRRAPGTPFDHFVVPDPFTDKILATTKLDRPGQTWTSKVQIPLGLFNVERGKARGTEWRMNFFRTVTSPALFPAQVMAAWSPPDVADFHVTAAFGHLKFT
ncbi:Extracellular protein [Cladobotryum mycophilum]|uniref:Extracellular protein n=1 Tax=Cladobotryum mycophilum TaxID=491253 RepID=A0ABR0SV91_9HYPO